MEFENKQTNKKQKKPHSYKEQIGGCQRWAKCVTIVKRYKIPVIRKINPGDVLYSMVTIVNNTVLDI